MKVRIVCVCRQTDPFPYQCTYLPQKCSKDMANELVENLVCFADMWAVTRNSLLILDRVEKNVALAYGRSYHDELLE